MSLEKSTKTTILYLLIFLLSSSYALSQNIKGFVFDYKTKVPLPYVNVFVIGTNAGASTNNDGYFNISGIGSGTFTLRITSVGYDTLLREVLVKENENYNGKFYLKEASRLTNTVVVQGSKEKTLRTTTSNVSVFRINPKQIERLPTIGGEPDIVQYLSVVPGIVSSGDQGGQLYFRGGTPVQNLTMLDGIWIYNPFHSIGLYSVFDNDIIAGADIYTAGYNAEYGSRTSGVMDVRTKDGAPGKASVAINLSPFTGKIASDGPLWADSNGNYLTYTASVRGALLNRTAEALYSYAEQNGTVLPYNFLDVLGKVTLGSNNGNKASVTAFNFTDEARLSKDAIYKWSNAGFGANFSLVPAASDVIISGTFAYSDYRINVEEAAVAPRFSRISGFNGGLNFSYFNNNDELKYGFNIVGNQAEFRSQLPNLLLTTLLENNTEISGFVKYRISRARFILEPGFRLQYYANAATFSPEPRLAAKYIVNEKFRIKTAGGLYSQNLFNTTSDREVVNLFNGFATSPAVVNRADGSRVSTPLQFARHFVIGAEYDINDNFTINLESYVKDFNQIININREKLTAATADFIAETGLARGIDFLLNYRSDNLSFQMGYSLAEVDRKFGNNTYRPNFDRRHNLNALLSYDLGSKKQWETNIRWNLGSGFPFTQTLGFFEELKFGGSITGNPATENGNIGIWYGGDDNLNRGRLPWFHRLDMSVKRNWQLKNKSVFSITASVSNMYNRENIFYLDRLTQTRFNQLPILPTLTVGWKY